ncbi:uncharacterized protein SPSC_01142 [Sporisorium scitamineum]|uniref:Uncharacterized protein n=1 Tax=Sporisorium scitamineum TaxID=49012 RepID=A0A127Z986_9BASI|nr:uncharacterized protein SPSC_01142 [Sporisorium scitamineum]
MAAEKRYQAQGLHDNLVRTVSWSWWISMFGRSHVEHVAYTAAGRNCTGCWMPWPGRVQSWGCPVHCVGCGVDFLQPKSPFVRFNSRLQPGMQLLLKLTKGFRRHSVVQESTLVGHARHHRYSDAYVPRLTLLALEKGTVISFRQADSKDCHGYSGSPRSLLLSDR